MHNFIKPTLFIILPLPHLLVFITDSAQPRRTRPAVAPEPTFAANVLQIKEGKHVNKTHAEKQKPTQSQFLTAGAQSTYIFTVQGASASLRSY